MVKRVHIQITDYMIAYCYVRALYQTSASIDLVLILFKRRQQINLDRLDGFLRAKGIRARLRYSRRRGTKGAKRNGAHRVLIK